MKNRFTTGLALGLACIVVTGAAYRVISNLQDLTNVRLAASPSSGDALIYNTTLGAWTNGTVSTGVTNYGPSLTNVVIRSDNGNALTVNTNALLVDTNNVRVGGRLTATNANFYGQTNYGTIYASGQTLQFANTALREISSSQVGTYGLFYANGIYNDGNFYFSGNGTVAAPRLTASEGYGVKFQTGTGSSYTNLAAQVVFLQVGSATNMVRAGGVLNVDTTQTGNVGAGEDTLQTYSVPANTLTANGDQLVFHAAGTFGNTANNMTLTAKFGATTLVTAGPNLYQNAAWEISGRVVRTGAATQKCFARISIGEGHAQVLTYTTAAETLSGAVTFLITGEGTDDNDIVKETFTLDYKPAP